MKGTKVTEFTDDLYTHRVEIARTVANCFQSNPDWTSEMLDGVIQRYIMRNAPRLLESYAASCEFGVAVHDAGRKVIVGMLQDQDEEVRTWLRDQLREIVGPMPFERAEASVVREGDPELERLLAEEEEIERRTQPPQVGGSTVTFTAEAMYHVGGYHEGLLTGIDELRRWMRAHDVPWSVEMLQERHDGRPSIVRISDYHRAAHRLVQNGSWSEDIALDPNGSGAVVELRARI